MPDLRPTQPYTATVSDPADLPDGQMRLYRAILRHFALYGIPPTFRWLMAELGIGSPNGIATHVARLTAKGMLVKNGDAGATRSLIPTALLGRLKAAASDVLEAMPTAS